VVLRIHFTPEDLARSRVSPGPLLMWEILLSTNRLRGRVADVIFGEWRRSVAARMRGRDNMTTGSRACEFSLTGISVSKTRARL